MKRYRTVIALLLALTVVGQGVALAQASAVAADTQSTADAGMPCHNQAQDERSCCTPDATCPDMLSCLTGHVLASAMSFAVPDAQADVASSRIASSPAANQPTTVFRPPIVIHG